MHTDTDLSNPPGRRIGALALIRNPAGNVLMVKPTYKEGWILPGGGAHPDEHAYEACAREVREETGLPLTPGRLLVVDYIPRNPHTKAAEGYSFVYDGGTAPEGIAITLSRPGSGEEPELSAYEFVPVYDLHAYAMPYQERRVRAAVTALDSGVLTYLVEGRQVKDVAADE
ncbi:NUDIX domain-containing protein [Streptantibioticus ferralitis]|uniref:NUDIX hydrolase n=1 Tax=Streptantibioticus ferralitis TaxID=236510 RepID=A0ABT5Z3L5_9ACTN|nr:NUDIX hydrolase [Streptantibioticus ferralitis]MDF2258393.1 NUDIX hydrolase [Streptantibioticus ferralitis]